MEIEQARRINRGNLFWLLIVAFLAMGFSGCVSPLARVTSDQLGTLSVDQIKALDAAGQAIAVCIQANGPPGAGSVVITSIPKSATGNLSFGPDCHPTISATLQGTVGVTPSPAPPVIN